MDCLRPGQISVVGYSSDGEKGEGIVDLIVTGNPIDPLQIYIENLDAEEAVKFLIRRKGL